MERHCLRMWFSHTVRSIPLRKAFQAPSAIRFSSFEPGPRPLSDKALAAGQVLSAWPPAVRAA